ncbi:ribosomal protein S18-alanine N-acetyltransferase [Parasalinivibrio latis]|uniref:ribosomal protein S18-alanine N-acetyltransferase n=1 Tax=Parasalinivibrio latis TaxID=2952610 RepID=UPI0030E223F6
MKIDFQPMAETHLDEVYQIEKAAHGWPWSENLIRQAPGRFGFNQVAMLNGKVAGYYYGQCVAGEATLLNIAVSPDCQGKGIGKALLNNFLEKSEIMGGEEAWLEVRASNIRAARLYESTGFNEIDRRIGYYPAKQGKEDALIMTYLF